MLFNRKFFQEWDILAQNPFLAFYQRWSWYTQKTPFINLWKHTTALRRIYFIFVLCLSCISTVLLYVHVTAISSYQEAIQNFSGSKMCKDRT